MKKILSVLFSVGLGFICGFQAQGQNKLARTDLQKMESKILRVSSDVQTSPYQDVLRSSAAKAEKYDTLWWTAEYANNRDNPCAKGYTMQTWGSGGDGPMNAPSWYTPYGSSLNGTGEVGVTFKTGNGEYYNFIGVDLSEYKVVGAVMAYARTGSSVWQKFPDLIEGLPDGKTVPDLPFVMKAYDKVEQQDVILNHFIEAEPQPIISSAYPVDFKDYVQTADTFYMEPSPAQDDDPKWPKGRGYFGGLFTKSIGAGADFSVSCQAIMPQKFWKADSIWNWMLLLKPLTDCNTSDDWVTYIVYDLLAGLKPEDGGDGREAVLIPYPEYASAENFLPEGNPQLAKNPKARYIFGYVQSAWSTDRGRTNPTNYLPMIYPLIQKIGVANELDNSIEKRVSVYPVPATENITFSSVDRILKVEIYNMAGMLMKHIVMNENVLEYDITGMTPGTYIAKIMTEKGIVSKKIVVR